MVAIIELKQGMTGAGILGIVVGKLRHWQQSCPIILRPIDKYSEVHFHCAVLFLSLAICLRVEGCK